ncbi:hypothetical protein ACNPQM_43030 [Streptomyces sp. NPDC056231]|uniref:hypothetical protein n=1 Tax=Streptomyces sp. NPDC056231 TaxID=3345755 RepID=UPI003AAEE5AB
MERLGEAVPGAGHTEQMAAVLDVLTTHAMFVDVTGRGQHDLIARAPSAHIAHAWMDRYRSEWSPS